MPEAAGFELVPPTSGWSNSTAVIEYFDTSPAKVVLLRGLWSNQYRDVSPKWRIVHEFSLRGIINIP